MAEIQKKVFCSIFVVVGKHLHTKLQKISSNGFDFANFLHFVVNFGCLLVKKRPKKAEIQKKFFYSIFVVVGKHLHTKFQKISSNSLDFANFLHFWSILAVFWLKTAKKAEIQKIIILQHFFIGKHLHTKFQKISSNGWILPIFFIFVNFGRFLAKKCQKAKIENRALW